MLQKKIQNQPQKLMDWQPAADAGPAER
jgi:hypothetical protein